MKKIFNLKYELLVLLFFVLVRLPNLGHDNFNTDVWKWKQRSYDFGTGVYGLQFEKTFQKYHPGVTLMWVGSSGVKIANVITSDVFPQNFPTEVSRIFFLDRVQKILLVLVMGFTYALAFYATRKIINTKYALTTFLLMSLEPFFLGLTRVFHLEGLMSILMLASMLWFYYFTRDMAYKKRLLVSGVLGGLALLTKTSAVYLILFIGFSSVFLTNLVSYKEKLTWKSLKLPIFVTIRWLFVALLTFVILWPVMWVNPLRALTGLYTGVAEVGVETDHAQIYFGNLVPDPGPLYYLVVTGLRTSVWLLLGFISGALFLLINKKYKKENPAMVQLFLYLLAYTLLYIIQISIPSKKLDRYILPAILSMFMIAGFTFQYLLGLLKKYRIIGIITLYLPALITLGIIRYDYLSYYSPLFGGLKSGMFILEPKWLIGKNEIMQYFKELKSERGFIDAPEDKSFEDLIYKRSEVSKMLTVGFQEKYYTQIWPFFRENNDWSLIMELRPFAVNTRFFVYPVWNDESSSEWRFPLKEQGKIYIRGVHAYTVYEKAL